jgi:uncharacterized phage-associated protein
MTPMSPESIAVNRITPIAAANEIIFHLRDCGIFVTPLKLELILYLTCGWYQAINDAEMITENFIASDKYPIIRSLDTYFKIDSSEVILFLAKDTSIVPGTVIQPRIKNNSEHRKLIDFIRMSAKSFRNGTSTHLLEMTNADCSPWHIARLGLRSSDEVVIHPEIIKPYFFNLAKQLSGKDIFPE